MAAYEEAVAQASDTMGKISEQDSSLMPSALVPLCVTATVGLCAVLVLLNARQHYQQVHNVLGPKLIRGGVALMAVASSGGLAYLVQARRQVEDAVGPQPRSSGFFFGD